MNRSQLTQLIADNIKSGVEMFILSEDEIYRLCEKKRLKSKGALAGSIERMYNNKLRRKNSRYRLSINLTPEYKFKFVIKHG